MAGGSAIRGSRVGAGPMGEKERGESAPLRSFDYALGGKDSIRSGRVRVQVDMGRPARIRTHCS